MIYGCRKYLFFLQYEWVRQRRARDKMQWKGKKKLTTSQSLFFYTKYQRNLNYVWVFSLAEPSSLLYSLESRSSCWWLNRSSKWSSFSFTHKLLNFDFSFSSPFFRVRGDFLVAITSTHIANCLGECKKKNALRYHRNCTETKKRIHSSRSPGAEQTTSVGIFTSQPIKKGEQINWPQRCWWWWRRMCAPHEDSTHLIIFSYSRWCTAIHLTAE